MYSRIEPCRGQRDACGWSYILRTQHSRKISGRRAQANFADIHTCRLTVYSSLTVWPVKASLDHVIVIASSS